MPPNGGATAPQGRLWSECPAGHIAIYCQRVVDIAAAAGVSIDTVRRIDRLDVLGLKIDSLIRVARAVGIVPTDLVPGLASRPRRPGLIQRYS